MAQAQAFAVVALCWAMAIASFVHGDTMIDIVNHCTADITACHSDQSGVTTCDVLTAGTSETINVGTVWEGGVIWAFPASEGTDTATGVAAKPQADLAEFTINDPNNAGQDSYDISVVNAYNLGMEITLTSIAGGTEPSGTTCESITCSIGDLNAFCQSPNTLTGPPGDGCYNVDGPGNVATSGTEQFAAACPTSISYSLDTTGKVFGCPTTSNYAVTFCP